MKNRITLIALFAVLTAPFSSCTDFLDKPPGVDLTEDIIFSSKKEIETFMFGTYMWGLHSYLPYGNLNGSINPNPKTFMTAYMTDEADTPQTNAGSQSWNTATILPSSIKGQEDSRFDIRWTAIRRCNLIIERMQTNEVLTAAERDQYTGEALFIRALNNFEMLKRYGGMPIVTEHLSVNDQLKRPRATFAVFAQHILDDCNESARLLKDVIYTSDKRGRITDAAVLALKSRASLYMASKLFNTATPYISGSEEQNSLVCYGSEEPQRWADAAEAALAAINAISKHGFEFIDTDNPENDYLATWQNDNKEIILAEKFRALSGSWQYPMCVITSKFVNSSTWGSVTVNVPHNFVRKYQKRNGEPQTWNEPGVRGSGLLEKYAELDPRFAQTMAYQGSKWSNLPEVQVEEADEDNGPGTHNTVDENMTGVFMNKLLPLEWQSGGNYFTPNGMLFRVTELYLNYAEALNESLDAPSREVYDAINKIRDRAGMPDLPEGLNKAQMREHIKNERSIELVFEDHRFWDIRRWMDADDEGEGAMQGDFLRVRVYQTFKGDKNLPQTCDYMLEVYERRSFNRNMYMHPIPEGEVNKGYLIQNPGW